MGDDDGDRIAPVIPLFGGITGRDARKAPSVNAGRPDDDGGRADAESVVPRRTGDAGLWRSTWDDLEPEGPQEQPQGEDLTVARSGYAHPVRDVSDHAAPRLRALRPQDEEEREPSPIDPEELRAGAEDLLVRKLRSKSLSVAEAKTVLRGFEQNGQRIAGDQIEDIVDDYCRRGYLDDVTLAWHLVTSGVERKGQGRIALSRSLAQRGLSRSVIDEALSELPDDDAERALEFARSKARSMSGVDPDAALRRLVGQLSRRGYNGSVAMTAAKTALRESSFGRPATGVRFVDSD